MGDVTTLVTEEMIAQQGIWGAPIVSDPVSESDIRRWAIAVYWGQQPPRLYWDRAYAETTRWGGIVAPEEFNPFAWPVPDGPPAAVGAAPGGPPVKGGNVLHGGQTETYGVRMRPADVITARSRLSHWEERRGRLGLTLYVYTETEWTNQRGELVKRRISTLIRY